MADSSRARCRWPSGNTFLINLLAQSHVFRHAEEKIKAGELWFGLVERRVTWGMLIGSQLVIDKSLAILWASDRQARSGFVILSQDTSSMGFRSKRSLADGQMCSGTKKKKKKRLRHCTERRRAAAARLAGFTSAHSGAASSCVPEQVWWHFLGLYERCGTYQNHHRRKSPHRRVDDSILQETDQMSASPWGLRTADQTWSFSAKVTLMNYFSTSNS